MAENEQVISALWSQGTLLDLDIKKSTFQKKIDPVDVDLEGYDKNALSLGRKKMLPDGALEPLIAIEADSRAYVACRSLSFPLSGARFVYYRTLKDVLMFLEQKRQEWDDEVETLVKNYEGLKAVQLKVLDDEALRLMNARLDGYTGNRRDEKVAGWSAWLELQRQKNRSLYPDINEVHKKFNFGWRMFKISAIDGMSAMSGMEADELLQAQDKLRAEMKDWVKQSSAALHKALGEAAVNAKNMLEKNGKLSSRNLKPLFEAFEVFKAVDFTGSSDFLNKVEEVRKKFLVVSPTGQVDMGATAESINSTDTGLQSFKDMLGTLSTLAVYDVAQAAGLNSLAKVGEFKRLIDL